MATSNSPPIIFLDEHLRSTTTSSDQPPSPPPPPPPSARSLLLAWSNLRSQSHLHSALLTLTSSPSLHISDHQFSLLLSLLPSSTPSTAPLLHRLLYRFLRKSHRPSPLLLSSAFPAISSTSSLLLISALAASTNLPPDTRHACLSLISNLLNSPTETHFPDILASIGYALSVADYPYFGDMLSSLFCLLRPRHTLVHGLMVLKLMEWCAGARSAEMICHGISRCGERVYARFAAVMAAAGVLRAVRMVGGKVERARLLVEEEIGLAAGEVVGGKVGGDERRVVMQCIAMAVVRCGRVSGSGDLVLCLFMALAEEIFPLPLLCRKAVGDPNCGVLGIGEVKGHLDWILFKEAGAVTGVLCNQYVLADEECKKAVENYMWEYSQELYRDFRVAALVHRGANAELLGDLERIAEAAFLMIVVFAAEVSKHRLNLKSYPKVRSDTAVKILIAFSCIEYLRRVRLPEYTDVVRSAVLTIQEDATLCASIAESMPPYAELTGQQGLLALEGSKYLWYEDEVQTARMLFYLRVIPTCIALIPASMFESIAPTMFLYMQHPNEKVARASHSVLVAFVSSGKDSEHEDGLDLKEKLAFYYMERALEAFPGVTPFEGLASGVAALVRHLPAGSPAIFYCIHMLVERATLLTRKAMTQDGTLWKSWEGSSEPCKKVLDLLLRLIYLVDIQVFPHLLKQLAEFVVRLPKDGQNVVLDEMYSQVAESDDVTRKPLLVSWLQSLSYICSQNAPFPTSTGTEGNPETSTGCDSSISRL